MKTKADQVQSKIAIITNSSKMIMPSRIFVRVSGLGNGKQSVVAVSLMA